MDDSKRARKTKLKRSIGNRHGILGILDASANDGIDIDREFGELGEVLEFLIQHLQTLHGNVIGLNVIDADLQVLESRFV